MSMANRLGVGIRPKLLSDGSKVFDVQLSNDGRIVITLEAIDEFSANALASQYGAAVESFTNERVTSE